MSDRTILPGWGYSLDEETYYTADNFTEELEGLIENIETAEGRIVQDGEIITGILVGDRFQPDITRLVNGAQIGEWMTENADETLEILTEDCPWFDKLHRSERVHRMIEQAVVQAVRAAIGTPTGWGVCNVREVNIRITSVEHMTWEVVKGEQP